LKKKALIIVFLLALIIIVVVAGGKCAGSSAPEEEPLSVSAAEVADIIIEEEKKEEDAKAEQESEGKESVDEAQPTPIVEPKLSDIAITMGERVNLEQANFSREEVLVSTYGEEWRVWMVSKIAFLKNAYIKTEIKDSIQLTVFLKPDKEEDNDNYVTIGFDLHPPEEADGSWSANIRKFESKTQGKSYFLFAYEINHKNWQTNEILHLARQVLDIAFQSEGGAE